MLKIQLHSTMLVIKKLLLFDQIQLLKKQVKVN